MPMHILWENYGENYRTGVKKSTLEHIASVLYKRAPASVTASDDLGNCAIDYALGAGFHLVKICILQGLYDRYCNLKRGSISKMKV